jgi:hypothetical protein
LPNFSSSLAFIPAAGVFAVKEGKETLCATTLSTIMVMHDKADAPSKV